MKKFFWLTAVLLVLTACGEAKIEKITSKSPKGDKTLEITGERKAAGDPIEVYVKATVKAGSTDFTFQHQATSLTSENCKVNWFNNESGEMTLTYDDGEKQVLEIFMQDSLINVRRKIEAK